ncbi:MAG TPA: flavin reductase family protein [Thermoplasmata archaeon]|nr:flavin reductase family protein [Thermoplasmata archaeon]
MTPGADLPADPARFRALMSRWATGVSVVTASANGADAGLTVNALLSVSLQPPAVLVSLSTDADTLPVAERSGHFGVSVLAAGQRTLSERFARTLPSEEKFRGVGLHRGPHGSPLLDGTLGALECRIARRSPAYDHVLLLGEVVHIEGGGEAAPLLYFRSGYAEEDPPGRLRLPERHP